MTIEIPTWVLVLIGVGLVVWIIAGIEAFKAARAVREKSEGSYLRFGMPPHFLPPDDADWWKKE